MHNTVPRRRSQTAPDFSARSAVLAALKHLQARIQSNEKAPYEEPLLHSELESLTVSWDEIPAWKQDNEFILTGYRRIQHSWRGCAFSLFGYLHNETVNIHSHLFGSLLFCFFLGTFYQTHVSHFATASWADVAVVSIFLCSAVLCLFLSAFFHTCDIHSEEVAASCCALDYGGIVVLTVGSFFACLYYGFYCNKALQTFYMTVIVIAGIASAYIVLSPQYSKSTYRGARTKVFVALGFSGIVPLIHMLVTHGSTKLWYEMGFGWILAAAAFYISGAFLYATRIPERFWPGSFDYFAASHQIFHVHVLLGALATYTCILTAFDYWHGQGAACALP